MSVCVACMMYVCLSVWLAGCVCCMSVCLCLSVYAAPLTLTHSNQPINPPTHMPIHMQFNVHDLMKRNGISAEDVTAGKYKRTLSPYKEPNAEDREHVKKSVEAILTEVRQSVMQHM